MNLTFQFLNPNGAGLPTVAPEQTSHNQQFYLSRKWLSFYWQRWDESEKTFIFQVVANHTILSAAWLSLATQRNLLGFNYQSIALNRSQSPKNASITVEKNGVALLDNLNVESTSAVDQKLLWEGLIKSLIKNRQWDELTCDCLDPDQSKALHTAAVANNLIAHTYTQAQTFWVNFKTIREQFGSDYLKSRSANTRAQLRKSKKLCEQELGPVELHQAKTVQQAMQWLSELGEFHNQKWNTTSAYVGFGSPDFVKFYQDLAIELLAANQLDLIKVTAGTTTLALLYNINYHGHVHFLMGGINYSTADKYRPGMLAHWLAIEHSLARGDQVYDFMVGTNRYKKSLSTDEQELSSLRVRRKRLFFLVEEIARNIKRFYRARLSKKDMGNMT